MSKNKAPWTTLGPWRASTEEMAIFNACLDRVKASVDLPLSTKTIVIEAMRTLAASIPKPKKGGKKQLDLFGRVS